MYRTCAVRRGFITERRERLSVTNWRGDPKMTGLKYIPETVRVMVNLNACALWLRTVSGAEEIGLVRPAATDCCWDVYIAASSRKTMPSFLVYVYATFIISITVASSEVRSPRELPLNRECNLNALGSCVKGDLISTSIADCERDSYVYTCKPINDYFASNVVDIPDTSSTRANCIPVNNPVVCGRSGTDTRCVCDQYFYHSTNQCRCQYWPLVDSRADKPSFCTQYDHGGTTGFHWYVCCNNCNDPGDKSCDKFTYQGGGSRGDYCSNCGQNSEAGGGRPTYHFNCESCAQQAFCKSKCDSGAGFLTKNIPGLCPAWAACCRDCCVNETLHWDK